MNICSKTKKACSGATGMGYCRFTACTKPPEIKREPLFDNTDEILIRAELLSKYITQKVDADTLRHALVEILKITDALDKRIKKLEKRSEP